MWRYLLILILLLPAAPPLYAQKGKETPPAKSDTVWVNGLVKTPLMLTRNHLEGLPLHTVNSHRIVNGKGEVKRTISTFRGILLKDIVAKADIELRHKEQGRYYVVITATDGYEVIFSYDELMYSPAAGGAYLATEIDGKAIEDGPFVVLSTSDQVSAPRHVKWVRSIEVRKI